MRGEAEVGGAWEAELVKVSLSIVTCLSGVYEAVAATGQWHGVAVAEQQVHAVG
jgi:hypothetical protein